MMIFQEMNVCFDSLKENVQPLSETNTSKVSESSNIPEKRKLIPDAKSIATNSTPEQTKKLKSEQESTSMEQPSKFKYVFVDVA